MAQSNRRGSFKRSQNTFAQVIKSDQKHKDDEYELLVIGVHGSTDRMQPMDFLNYLKDKVQYNPNGKFECFNPEGFNLDRQPKYRITFKSRELRQAFLDVCPLDKVTDQISNLPDEIQRQIARASGAFTISFRPPNSQVDHVCLLKVVEPQGQTLAVKLHNLKSRIPDEAIVEVLSQYGKVDPKLIRLTYKGFAFENGTRIANMRDLKVDTHIPPTLFIGGQKVKVRYSGQWLVTPCYHCQKSGHMNRDCPNQCAHCGGRCQASGRCPGRTNPDEDGSRDPQNELTNQMGPVDANGQKKGEITEQVDTRGETHNDQAHTSLAEETNTETVMDPNDTSSQAIPTGNTQDKSTSNSWAGGKQSDRLLNMLAGEAAQRLRVKAEKAARQQAGLDTSNVSSIGEPALDGEMSDDTDDTDATDAHRKRPRSDDSSDSDKTTKRLPSVGSGPAQPGEV